MDILMKQFEYTITDPQGIHARPAGLLIKEASKYESDIKIEAGGKTSDAKRIFAVMGMGIKCGDKITVSVNGGDEEQAAASFREFLEKNL